MLTHLVNNPTPPLLIQQQSGGNNNNNRRGGNIRYKYVTSGGGGGGSSNNCYKKKGGGRNSKERLFHEGPYYAKLLVPDSVASILMGAQGSNIISVESSTQTSIRFSPRGHYFPNSKLRILVIAARSLSMLIYLVRMLIIEYILSPTSTSTTNNKDNCVYISVIGYELLKQVMESCKPFVDSTLSMIYHNERIISITLSSHFGDVEALADTCSRVISIMQYDYHHHDNNVTRGMMMTRNKNIRLIYPTYTSKDYRTNIIGILDNYECIITMNGPSCFLTTTTYSPSSCEFFRAVAKAHNVLIDVICLPSTIHHQHHQQQQQTTTTTSCTASTILPSLFGISGNGSEHPTKGVKEDLLDFAAHIDDSHDDAAASDDADDDNIYSATTSHDLTDMTVLPHNYNSSSSYYYSSYSHHHLSDINTCKNISEYILLFKGKITDIHLAQSAICAGVW